MNKQTLGREGERFAEQLLGEAGFISIKQMNAIRTNYPFADLYAERDGQKYAISVKARNRYEKPRKGDTHRRENPRFRLGGARKCRELARRVAEELAVKGAWVIIRYEPQVCDAYFGTLDQIDQLCRKPPATAILTGPEYLSQYECLCTNRPHGLDYGQITNVP